MTDLSRLERLLQLRALTGEICDRRFEAGDFDGGDRMLARVRVLSAEITRVVVS